MPERRGEAKARAVAAGLGEREAAGCQDEAFGAQLPAANVIVNPNVPGSRFASRALAGVGVEGSKFVAARASVKSTVLRKGSAARRRIALCTVTPASPLRDR